MKQLKDILITFSPIIILIMMLLYNVLYFKNPLDGPNQIALLIAALFGGVLAYNRENVSIKNLGKGVVENINSSMTAMIILLIIGGLTATWILSGIVPAMIYYGIELMNPQFFLITTCVICAIVSLSTGSSWTTAATIGLALIGVSELLEINKGLAAGAIISGAYFGDKMSPLSETTNLAPSVSGSELIDHIKYMSYTTIPTITITLLLFFLIGIKSDPTIVPLDKIEILKKTIESNFYIGVELFILPLIIVVLIYKKVSAIKVLLIGLFTGALFAFIFQGELIHQINMNTNSCSNIYALGNPTTIETITKTIFLGTDIDLNNNDINQLLDKKGVSGMFWIILLVLSAMTFGGVMYKGGFLKKITGLLVSKSSSKTQLIGSTAGSCLFFNISTCDQYLAIVIPGRMFKEVYEEHQLDPSNLSRTIEDSGTVTSVLIPWNTCAAYHYEILAVNPIVYLPFCFFNIISPFMTLFFAYMNIRIKKLNHNEKKQKI